MSHVTRFTSIDLTASAGFTLIEMLVAMASGLVIVGAIVIMVDTSLKTTTRITDTVSAEQQARSGMERLVQDLNSGCVVAGISPIQASNANVTGASTTVNSDASHLVFVNGEQSGSTFTATIANGSGGTTTINTLDEHVVELNSQGQLVDYVYPYTGGSAPTPTTASTWTFAAASPPVVNVLALHVAAVSFTYYTYANTSNPSTGSLDGVEPTTSPITGLTLPTGSGGLTSLSSTWPPTAGQTNAAGSVAQVDIALEVEPTDGRVDVTRYATAEDSVVFRFTPPATASTSNEPCE